MVQIKGADVIRKLLKEHPLEYRRIFSIVAHVDHGKTTTTDYLLKRAGLMAEEVAGKKLMTDYDQEERQRGITIFTSVVTLLYKYQGKEYLFTINDTPGHISFTGEVSRALRGSDGAVILVDALEGVMTQTETNIRLALQEMCKPVLYINKVDRLISELRLEPKKVLVRIDQIIREVNRLIHKYSPKEFKGKRKVDFPDDSVAFGSAKDGRGVIFSMLKERGDPKKALMEIFEHYNKGDIDRLRENYPLDEALLRMIIKHLPSPVEAQRYKIPKIRRGDLNSEVGKAMLNVDPDGPLVGMITKILIHPKSKRPILIGRIFSGTLKQGQEIKLITSKSVARVQRLGTLVITDMLDIDEMPAGNLFATMGFVAPAGESFSDPNIDIPPFEEIKYASEPVVSVSIYPKDPKDIAKLGEAVRIRVLADPTLRFYYDQESQTYILSGIDPLQLEIVIKRINEMVPIKVEPPIIVYREKPEARGQEFHTKSLNALNRIKIYVEPMPDELAKAIRDGEITDDMDPKKRAEILRTKFGRDSRLARNVVKIEGTNMLVNATVGIQRLDRIMDSIEGAFVDFVHGGPLAKEPVMNMIAYITDATVHEDPAHTGPAQIVPMVNAALTLSFLTAQPRLYEPILKLDIKTPMKYLGAIQTIIGKRRGQVIEIEQEDEDTMRVIALVPAAETLDLANELRSATQGRAFYGYEFHSFAPVPQRLQDELIKKIRERKGLPPEPPKIEDFQRFIYVRQD